MTSLSPAAARLRALLERPGLHVMPCCFDALSARLVEGAGFGLTFMSGFAVSATRLGAPDTGLISYGEMVEQGRNLCAAVEIPVIGDVLLKGAVARFPRTLGTLISSGVPILAGLEITARTAGNKIISEAIMTARASIREGETVSAPLKASP